MNHSLLQYLKYLILIGNSFLILCCTQKKSEVAPVEKSVEINNSKKETEVFPVKEITVAEVAPKNDLAQILTLIKNVDYRLSNESLWKPASAGNGFNRNDALQTEEASHALVKYKSGTQLELKQNSLIVFDADPGSKTSTHHEDRVIFKKGELVGATKSELWVFTQAGLVQIKTPSGKNKSARAQITIPNENRLKLKIEIGTAELIYAKNNKYEKIQIKNSNELTLDNSQVDFTTSTSSAEISQLQKALQEVKVPTKSNLIIDNPKEDAGTTESTYLVSGQVVGPGGQLLINGELVPLESDSKFSKKITLAFGANLIVFQLIRSDSSVQFLRRTIKLSKPQ